MIHRVRGWSAQWGPIFPLLVAELTIWIGFGALLPILPIYFTEHGVDIKTLGVVVAAWPAARLVGEPLFGWLADRVPRKPLMVTGLLLASAFAVLPLYIVGPVAFVIFRALSGFATAMYDPAARGYIVDANPPERQGEAFGVYGSAQTGGFLIGPALGGIAAAITGQPTIVFWIAGITLVISAAARRVARAGARARAPPSPPRPTTSRRTTPACRGHGACSTCCSCRRWRSRWRRTSPAAATR